MKRIVFAIFLTVQATIWAIDVDPSRKTVPEKFNNSGGAQFSIFAGDPERIKRANAINFGDFEGSIEVTPAQLSLKSAEQEFKSIFNVNFGFRNKGKKTYTLSFKNAQRYDIVIKNPSGQIVYTWSDDKIFIEAIGTSLVNSQDKISFSVPININDLTSTTPGTYTVIATMANYPELTVTSTIQIN